jgi:hypothetical protein
MCTKYWFSTSSASVWAATAFCGLPISLYTGICKGFSCSLSSTVR